MRFLHTADWQVGRHYPRFEAEDAMALFEARFAVVEGIARHAAQGRFDAVLVAGDVFDAQTVSERTIRRLFNAMDAYDGPWILIPGNHDAALAQSVWTHVAQLRIVPANVHLALTAEPIINDEQGWAVLPAPLTQRHTLADATAWFDHAELASDYVRVGLAHGSVQGILSAEAASTNPIAAGRARSAGLDYLALGDWHGMLQVDERTWYSGTPETDRFRNNDSGHILEVSIAARGAVPVVTPLRTSQYQWEVWERDIQVDSDVDLLLQDLSGLSASHVLQLKLSGQLDLAAQRRLGEGLAAAAARVRVLECDQAALRLRATSADVAAMQLDGYLLEVVEGLQAAQQEGPDDEAAVARDALLMLADVLREVRS